MKLGELQERYQEARKSSSRIGAAQRKSCRGRVRVRGMRASGLERKGRRKSRPPSREMAAARASLARTSRRRSYQWRPGMKKALRAVQ